MKNKDKFKKKTIKITISIVLLLLGTYCMTIGLNVTSSMKYLFFSFGLFFIVVGIFYPFYSKKTEISIEIEKTFFKPGEKINGRVVTNLKKPLRANSLKIQFNCYKLIRSPDYYDNHYKFYSEEIVLDKECEFYENYYNFEFKIPKDILVKADECYDNLKDSKFIKKYMGALEKTRLVRQVDEYALEVILDVSNRFNKRTRKVVQIQKN